MTVLKASIKLLGTVYEIRASLSNDFPPLAMKAAGVSDTGRLGGGVAAAPLIDCQQGIVSWYCLIVKTGD